MTGIDQTRLPDKRHILQQKRTTTEGVQCDPRAKFDYQH